MKKITTMCLVCGRSTPHTSFCEQTTTEYNGVLVEYTDKGFLCDVCGETYTPPDMYDDIMREIQEEYAAKKHH